MDTLNYVFSMVALLLGGVGVGFALAILTKPKLFTAESKPESKPETKPAPEKTEDTANNVSAILEQLCELLSITEDAEDNEPCLFDLDKLKQACDRAILFGQTPQAVAELDDGIITFGKMVSTCEVINAKEVAEYIASILEKKDAIRIMQKSGDLFQFVFNNENRCCMVKIRP